MPRKSRAVRTSQAKELIAQYELAGMSQAKTCRFAKDMVWRLEKDKGLSQGQRRWLDNLIEEGVPEPKNLELMLVLQAAAEVVGMESKSEILMDFAYRARMGWNFSEKQNQFVEMLIKKSEELRKNGPYSPNEDQVKQLESCIELSKARSSMYWSGHPGEAKALHFVSAWLDWNNDKDSFSRPALDEWHVERMLKTFRSKLEKLNSPKFKPGDMYWYYVHQDKDFHPAVLLSGPHIDDSGVIVYEALVDGKIFFTDRVVKTRRR